MFSHHQGLAMTPNTCMVGVGTISVVMPCSWNLVAPPFDLQERKICLKLRWEQKHQPLVLIHLLLAPF